MRFSTTSVAQACSRHPGRTLAVWGVVLVGSIAALMFMLTGFTTEATASNNPESDHADERMSAAFPRDPQRAVSNVVIVRSTSLTATDPASRRPGRAGAAAAARPAKPHARRQGPRNPRRVGRHIGGRSAVRATRGDSPGLRATGHRRRLV